MRKFPFIASVIGVLLATLAVFTYFVLQTFSEDKRTFVMELNHTLLRSTTANIKFEIKTRLDEMETFLPRVFAAERDSVRKKEDLFEGLRPALKLELASVTFFKWTNEKIEPFRQYRNQRLFSKRHLGKEALTAVNQTRPIPLNDFFPAKKLLLLNRSILAPSKKGDVELNLITIVMDGSFIPGSVAGTAVAIDFVPDFLRKILRQSEIADVFLMLGDGRLLCHNDPKMTREHSDRSMNHPIQAKLKPGLLVKETLDLPFRDQDYFVSAAETGFENIYVVSQTRKGDAFLALRTLVEKGMALAVAAVGLLLLLVLTVAFLLRGKPKPAPVEKVQPAPERIDRRTAPVIPKKRDIEPTPLLEVSGTPPEILPAEQVASQLYFPAADAPSALVGGQQFGEQFEFFIGEVRPAELPKPLIADALALTQDGLEEARAKHLGPGDALALCNAKLHAMFRGRLFMTLAIGHLDLVTGKLEIASAGQPPPLRLKAVSADTHSSDKEHKRRVEVLLARGERLGTKAEVGYPSVVYQLELGDRILAFTQGVVEAKNLKGSPWGTDGLAGYFVSAMDSGNGISRVAAGLEAHAADQLPRGDRAIFWFEWKERVERALTVAPAQNEPGPEAVTIEPIDLETRQEYLYSRSKTETETESDDDHHDFRKAA